MSDRRVPQHSRFYLYTGQHKTRSITLLALCAAGANKKVYIAQFVDDDRYSQLETNGYSITVRRFDLPGLGVPRRGTLIDDILVESSLRQVGYALRSREYDLVILDEAREAIARQIFTPEEIYSLLKSKPPGVEVALA